MGVMGGCGSGRWGWHSKKDTVEDCLVLSVKDLRRLGYLRPGGSVWGSLQWSQVRTSQVTASVSCETQIYAAGWGRGS